MNMRERVLSEQLANFIADSSFDDLPHEVAGKAKRHLLDTLGAALAGARTAPARAARSVMDSTGDAIVWGTSRRANARDAAFINGIAAHALELDDSGGCDHSGAVVVPAALSTLAALGRVERPVSGRELLHAIVLGYDIARRVLEACGGYSAHNGRGWHSTMTCGVIGAAAASARVLGLDARGTGAALGHAASFAGGLWGFIHDGSQTKRLHPGRAAEGGLTAALLAAQGVSGATHVFEDVWGGFLRTFAADSACADALVAELGANWKIMRCSIKPHACCRSIHSALDALIELARGGPVAHVRVTLSEFVHGMCGDRKPVNLASAQMSMPYALAAALVFGHAGIEAFVERARIDARVTSMMQRIVLEPDALLADLDEPEVTVTYADGTTRSLQATIPLGDPRRPLDDAQLLAKYRSLADDVIGSDAATALAHAVLNVEECADAKALERLLVGRDGWNASEICVT
ncbi:MmgE/PrpD family protein [Caballeronia temeraria]|uniref:MmgE/PrpD family protein n=1 Tax=Caballeronia temeraria TaxID=1777137 RepID=A0A158AT48_9BURK|nr:MmgE/PrpD family protein [Caballeronia temeraria]SAK60830.1 MmgE/PrpD family protein [Caballeronia temeraria]